MKRDEEIEQKIGIRAHPDMDFAKSMKSLIVPWHNEWLSIWFYLVFAIYFWIETIIIMSHNYSQYAFIKNKDYDLMFIATFGIASSLTMTTVYLIFYS